jgi:hypothetical protein
LLLIISRGGHAQLFFESAIAIPQLEGSTSAIAIPQLEESTSAIAILQLLNVAPQLQLRNSAIKIISEVRNLRALLPQFSAYFWPSSS